MAAKLKPIPFRHRSDAGEEYAYAADVTVDQSGLFNVTLPAEMEEHAEALWRKRRDDGIDRVSSLTRPARQMRITSPELRIAQDFVLALLREHLECEVTKELVILYGSDVKVCYVKQPDGGIYANGRQVPPGTYEGDQWRGTLSGTRFDQFYRVGFAACVREKTTHRRTSASKVVWDRVNDESRPGVAALNAFVGLDIKEGGMKQMPYTEEAAMFFHGIMMSMILLADRIEGFFSDAETVQKAIAGQAQHALLGYGGPAGTPTMNGE